MIESLLENNEYIAQTPKGQREIKFSRPFSDSEFTDWQIKPEQGTPKLLLMGEGKVLCKLQYGKDKWEGRDVRGGYTTVTPKNTKIWAEFFRPARAKPHSPQQLQEKTGMLDYKKHEIQLKEYYSQQNKHAIIIIGCNRPEFFKRVVDSIYENNLKDYDVYFFIDKPVLDGEYRLHEQVLKIAKDRSTNVIQRPTNFGCGRNIIDARRQVFSLGYDRVFVMEDDLVISPTYFRFCQSLMDWGKQYSNVGAVQGWAKCLLQPHIKETMLDQVHATFTNWWGYLMTKEAWYDIEPFMLTYMDTYLYNEYNRRPVRSILDWFKPFADREFSTKENGFIPDRISLEHRRNIFLSIPTGQDAATWLSFDNQGYVRLAPTVNRSLYIGTQGIHMSPRQFQKDKFDKVTLENYSDARRKKFNPRQT